MIVRKSNSTSASLEVGLPLAMAKDLKLKAGDIVFFVKRRGFWRVVKYEG